MEQPLTNHSNIGYSSLQLLLGGKSRTLSVLTKKIHEELFFLYGSLGFPETGFLLEQWHSCLYS